MLKYKIPAKCRIKERILINKHIPVVRVRQNISERNTKFPSSCIEFGDISREGPESCPQFCPSNIEFGACCCGNRARGRIDFSDGRVIH